MKFAQEAEQKSEKSFTSLIDIVFLLLIFFMCATQFKQVEMRLDAFLPNGIKGDDPHIEEELSIFVKDDLIARKSPVHHVRATRQATFYPMSRDARPITDLNELHSILAQIHEAQPGTRILITPFNEDRDRDQLVPFFNIVAVLDTCKLVGFQNVAFQAPAVVME